MGTNPERISGMLKALGQSEFDREGHSYAYLSFAVDDGQVVTKENVIVQNACNSYLTPALKGRFYVANLGQTCVLYGLQVGGRSVGQAGEVSKVELPLLTSGNVLPRDWVPPRVPLLP